MTIKTKIKKIIKLAIERNIEYEALKRKYGISGLLFPPDKKTTEYLNAPRPKDAKLRKYIKSLNTTELATIASVMYGGREYLTSGEDQNFKQIYGAMKKRKRLDISVCEKIPLPEYLECGLKIFKIK